MDFQDIAIKCATCGREFLFTAKEQEFFLNKGFKEPRHCRECRQSRKREREQAVAAASGLAYQPGRQTFQVVCAQCHRETSVPFKPITGKPVLCKDCFIAQRYGTAVQRGPEKAPEEKPSKPPEKDKASAVTEAIPVDGAAVDLEPEEKAEEEVKPVAMPSEPVSDPKSEETVSTDKLDTDSGTPVSTSEKNSKPKKSKPQKEKKPKEGRPPETGDSGGSVPEGNGN